MQQERNIIANTYDAAPLGLEIFGPNSEVSQTQELIENARSIAFFGLVKAGIEKFADYTGSLGKKISPRSLMLLGGIGTMAVAAACGGGSKDNSDQVSTKPDAPAAPAVVRTIETTSTPAPAIKAEAPKPNTELQLPSATEVAKSAIPEDAQKILNGMGLLTSFKPEENEAIAKDFTVIWSNAKTDFQKYGSYKRLYGILSAKYNITRDSAVLLEMNKAEQTIAQKWPVLYQNDAANNGFFREPGK